MNTRRDLLRSHLDRYGVPVSRIEYKIGENERKMAAEMHDTAEQILRATRAESMPFQRGHLDVAGSAIHEHGAAFTTASEKNPTQEMKSGRV